MGGNFKNRNKSKPPAERLERSHRRLEEELAELSQCALALVASPASRTHWATAAEVLSFLEENGLRHEEDEEQSVFPRLAKYPSLRPLLKRLRADHLRQRKLVASLAKVIAAPKLAGAVAKLGKISGELEASYHAHIECEDEELLPAMRTLLDVTQQAQIAAEMATRRS